MNKFIKIVLLVSVLLIFSGCAQESLELDFEKPFSEKQVINVLEENLGKIDKVSKDIKEEDKIEGISPSVYQLENDEGLVYIYVFDSLSARKKTNLGNTFDHFYPTNNILVKYDFSQDSIEAWKKNKEVQNVVLKKLNPYQENTYFANGDNWIAYYTVAYYEYFSNDGSGTLIHEAWSNKLGKAIFKKEADSSFPVSYAIKLGNLESSSGETHLYNGEVGFGSGGGNTAHGKDLQSIELKMNWEGQEEILFLEKNDIEIKYEVDKEVPPIVKDLAFDYVRLNLADINSFENEKVVDAKIIGLNQLNTGTATENYDIQMWVLEYRILSESDQPLVVAGGMTLDDGWRTEYSSMGQPIIVVGHYFETESWRKIGITHTGNIVEEYDGNYSEAAIKIYEKFKEKN